jgi:ElaB/YqjD/DUF883 family membrane-anchored ribosome-binding protein
MTDSERTQDATADDEQTREARLPDVSGEPTVPPDDIERLEQETAKTRAEMAATVDALAAKVDVKSQAKQVVDEKKDQARAKADEVRERAQNVKEQVPFVGDVESGEAAQRVGGVAQEASGGFEAWARRRPYVVVGVALVAGLLVGRAVAKRR